MVNRRKAKHTVLVVDDNAAHRYILCHLLEREGFLTIEAGTGAEAVSKSKSDLPSVIILDVHMPDAIGWEVAKMLKGDEKTKHIPIIFLSSTISSEVAHRTAQQVGADSFMTWPVESQHLVTAISASLARAASQGGRT